MLQFCKLNEVIVTNTRYDKPLHQKVTFRKFWTPWGKPIEQGGYEQIDYLLVGQRFKNSVLNAESDGRAQLNTDHFPVKSRISCRFKKEDGQLNQTPTQYSRKQIEKLNPREMNYFMKENLRGRDPLDYGTWAQCYSEYVSQQPKKRKARKQWYITGETLQLITNRNQNAASMTPGEKQLAGKQIKRMARRDKRKWKQQRVKRTMGSKEKWEGIKTLRSEFKPTLYAKRDRFGNYTSLERRAHATAEYLAEEQWTNKNPAMDIDVSATVRKDLEDRKTKEDTPNIRDEPITEEEFAAIIKKMSRGKAPGPDNVTTDWIKDLDRENRKWLLGLINSWWEAGSFPKEMEEARVVSLYKKGDPSRQENYRPISLLNTFYKIVAAAIKIRLEEGLEEKIANTQFGFRKGKSTTHAMFVARRIQEYAERAGLPGTMIFLDWEKAFDKIRHDWLLEVLDSYQIPSKIRNFVSKLYERPRFKVEVEGRESDWMVQASGIRQGCPLSPYLFILTMNRIFEQVGCLKHVFCKKLFGCEYEPMQMGNLDFSELLFADDTLIFASPGHSLDAFLWAVEAVSGVYGLSLNRSKCARVSLKGVAANVFFNGEEVPNADRTEYLGGTINARADPNIEISKRISGAWYVWQQLKEFWRDGLLSKRQKILIYDALVSSKLLYGLHTLPLNDNLLNRIDAFHLSGLRRILGLKTTFIVRSNTNEKVLRVAEEEINKGRNTGGERKRIRIMSERIKDKSAQELGELLRLEDSDPRRKVTFLSSSAQPNLPPINRVGQPRTHWALATMKRVWERVSGHDDLSFDPRNEDHLKIILDSAALNLF